MTRRGATADPQRIPFQERWIDFCRRTLFGLLLALGAPTVATAADAEVYSKTTLTEDGRTGMAVAFSPDGTKIVLELVNARIDLLVGQLLRRATVGDVHLLPGLAPAAIEQRVARGDRGGGVPRNLWVRC